MSLWLVIPVCLVAAILILVGLYHLSLGMTLFLPYCIGALDSQGDNGDGNWDEPAPEERTFKQVLRSSAGWIVKPVSACVIRFFILPCQRLWAGISGPFTKKIPPCPPTERPAS